MSNLFSNEKVNTGRQIELDIAKALSIIFMIFVHPLMVVPAFNSSLSPTYVFIFGNVLGRPLAAPIFMFCMGVGIVYSRRSQWDTMIKRGVKLYLLGILVNIFEFFLPCFVCGTLLGRWDVFPMAGGLLLFCVDILAFVGMAFVLMGILKKFEISNKWLIVIAVAMSIIGTLLRGTDLGNPVLNLIAGHFIGAAGGFTAFPLLPWFIFPIAGLVWGQYFIRAKDKRQFFKLWPVFLIAALAYFYVTSNVIGSGIFSTDIHLYYFMTTLDALFCVACAHGFIGLCYYLAQYLPDMIIKACSILSSHITYIYIAQWFFIPLGVILLAYFFKALVFNDLVCCIFSIFIVVLSTLVAVYYKKLRTSKS